MILHQLNRRLPRLVRSVFIQDVVDVDEDCAEVGDLGGCVGGRDGECARELEEVEEEGLGEAFELKGAVVVFGVFGGRGRGGGEVGDALVFEGGEFIVELHARNSGQSKEVLYVIVYDFRLTETSDIPYIDHQTLSIVHLPAQQEAEVSVNARAHRGSAQVFVRHLVALRTRHVVRQSLLRDLV